MKIYQYKDYLDEIITSFKEISDKNFVFNFDQDSNIKKLQNLLKLYMV